MKSFKPGDWVIAPTGRTGRVNSVKNGRAVCQFGADGPIRNLSVTSLRWATKEEIMVATGEVEG